MSHARGQSKPQGTGPALPRPLAAAHSVNFQRSSMQSNDVEADSVGSCPQKRELPRSSSCISASSSPYLRGRRARGRQRLTTPGLPPTGQRTGQRSHDAKAPDLGVALDGVDK